MPFSQNQIWREFRQDRLKCSNTLAVMSRWQGNVKLCVICMTDVLRLSNSGNRCEKRTCWTCLSFWEFSMQRAVFISHSCSYFDSLLVFHRTYADSSATIPVNFVLDDCCLWVNAVAIILISASRSRARCERYFYRETFWNNFRTFKVIQR